MQQQQQQQQLPGEVEAAITRVDEALALLTRIQLAQSRLVTQMYVATPLALPCSKHHPFIVQKDKTLWSRHTPSRSCPVTHHTCTRCHGN